MAVGPSTSILRINSWRRRTSFAPCTKEFSCVKTRRQSLLSFANVLASVVSTTSSGVHGHTILQEKRAAEIYDEVGQRSLERLFPGFTEDSSEQTTLSASRALGTRGRWTLLALHTLAHSLQPNRASLAMIQDAVTAGLLLEQPLVTRLAAVSEAATTTNLEALDDEDKATGRRSNTAALPHRMTTMMADIFTTAAVPGRSVALDVCVASTNAAARGDAAQVAFDREIPDNRGQGIVYRSMVWTADGHPHPAATRALQYAAYIASSRNGQQILETSLQHKWKHEIQIAFLRRRAAMTMAVLPNHSARAEGLLASLMDRALGHWVRARSTEVTVTKAQTQGQTLPYFTMMSSTSLRPSSLWSCPLAPIRQLTSSFFDVFRATWSLTLSSKTTVCALQSLPTCLPSNEQQTGGVPQDNHLYHSYSWPTGESVLVVAVFALPPRASGFLLQLMDLTHIWSGGVTTTSTGATSLPWQLLSTCCLRWIPHGRSRHGSPVRFPSRSPQWQSFSPGTCLTRLQCCTQQEQFTNILETPKIFRRRLSLGTTTATAAATSGPYRSAASGPL